MCRQCNGYQHRKWKKFKFSPSLLHSLYTAADSGKDINSSLPPYKLNIKINRVL